MQNSQNSFAVEAGKRELIAKLAISALAMRIRQASRIRNSKARPVPLDNRQFRAIFSHDTKLIFITAPSSKLRHLGAWCGVLPSLMEERVAPVLRGGGSPDRSVREPLARPSASRILTTIMVHGTATFNVPGASSDEDDIIFMLLGTQNHFALCFAATIQPTFGPLRRTPCR